MHVVPEKILWQCILGLTRNTQSYHMTYYKTLHMSMRIIIEQVFPLTTTRKAARKAL